MDERHPGEMALARFSDLGDGRAVDEELAEHVQRCASCRTLVAEYGWLERELASTFDAVAEAAPRPRPRWWDVQERLDVAHRRPRVAGQMAVAGVALLACLMLFAPSFVGPLVGPTVEAQTSRPGAAMAPTPLVIGTTGDAGTSSHHEAPLPTPTPAPSYGVRGGAAMTPMTTRTRSVSEPAFEEPPTPPEPDVQQP